MFLQMFVNAYASNEASLWKRMEPNENAEICSICTDPIEGQVNQRITEFNCEPSQHRFHSRCINPWFSSGKSTCPNCRRELHPEEIPEDLFEEFLDAVRDGKPRRSSQHGSKWC